MNKEIQYPSSYQSILNSKGNKTENYQQKAVRFLYNKIRAEINNTRQNDLFDMNDESYIYQRYLLQAPTGAGKTIMAGALIDLVNENHKDVVYLWISETPNLVNQSREKFKKVFDLTCYQFGDSGIRHTLPANSVTCINWEKIKGDKANEDTEQQNSLLTLVEEAREDGLFLVVLIDEAHSHAGSKLSQDFLGKIKPNLVIEITATPEEKLKYYHAAHVVKIEDVKKTGFIKQGIIINKDIGTDILYNEDYQKKHEVIDLGEFILNESLLKKDELKAKLAEYADLKKKELVNPLLVVQLPNSNESLMNSVAAFFEKKGYSRNDGNYKGNGKLAVYTSKDYTDELDNIGKDENVEVLLFKQAISKGWDCPRASILTFIREPKSQTLTTQTIGRIMRMPYLEKYPTNFDVLNYGYIYIESTSNTLIQEYQSKVNEATGSETISMKSNIETHFNKLKKISWVEDPKVDKYKEIGKKARNIDWKNVLDLTKNKNELILSIFSGDIAVENLSENKNIELKSIEIDINGITNIDIQNKLDKLLKEYKITPSIVKEIIYQNLLSTKQFKDLTEIQLIVINNIELIREKIDDIESSIVVYKKQSQLEYSIPLSYETTEEKEIDEFLNEKSMYQKVKYKLNGLETKFIDFVHNDKKVIRWHRNGEKQFNHFFIAYMHGNDYRHFYPDFLIETESTVYIIDTKGDLTKEDGWKKYQAMKNYEQSIHIPDFNKKIKIGYVQEQKGQLYIYNGNDLEREYMDLSKWSLLSFE